MTSAVSGLSAALFRDEPEEYVVTTALGSNRDICFVSKNGTTNKVEIVVGGVTAPLSVAVVGPKLTVTSANTDGSATSTAAAIVAAVNANVDAFALFEARLPPGSTGAGVTGAMSEKTAADGVAFTALSLSDSGDHLTYQAAAGSRYWDEDETLSILVDAAPVASGFTVDRLQGSVTFETSQEGSAITATGTRRSLLAFQKVFGLFDGKLKIDGKEIDTTSVDDSGWGSSLAGSRSWEMSAGHFFYGGDIPIETMTAKYLWKFYSKLSTSTAFAIGWGTIMSMENLLANPNEAQKQTITVKGSGELYIE
ncbi:hypothetical protein M0R72_11075 [Candidatus Pacearchaeota archaeon]|jgi:hypothetical protein|nr:hypothetical protein [Candidatus Pacearchaeota archaeon]